jgi:hypothetical protein
MFVSFISALLDILHVLHSEISDGLIGLSNLCNSLEDYILFPIVNHLVEAVRQDLVNCDGRFWSNILHVVRLSV